MDMDRSVSFAFINTDKQRVNIILTYTCVVDIHFGHCHFSSQLEQR